MNSQVIKETIKNGIKVHINGEEYDLKEVDPNAMESMLDNLSDEEISKLKAEIEEQLSEEEIAQLNAMANEYLIPEEEMITEGEGIALPPIILGVPDNGEVAINVESFLKGIDNASTIVGEFTALVNGGLTGSQAYNIVTMNLKHAQEIEMFDKQAELTKVIKEKELEVQLSVQGLKQLLTEE